MLRRSFIPLAVSSAVIPPANGSTTLYELRTMDIIPSHYDSFHRLSMENMPKYPGGGKCMGFWTVQLGALNQFLSIWHYDNLKHRYDCGKKIDADKEWQRDYEQPLVTHIYRQDNCLMRMIYREGNASTMSYKYAMQSSPVKEVDLAGPSATLAATFQVLVGEQEGRYIHIVKARNLDDVIPVAPIMNCQSKIMGPARWSPSIGCIWR